jgi:lysyl-tRNA synthetase class 2
MGRFEFEATLAAAGDAEAHPADLDFVRALQYGLPPTSGIGIGVDRLVMLLAEVVNIRDVILFPVLRPR